MCSASLNDTPDVFQILNENLRGTIGFECIGRVRRRSRLKWFGHTEMMDQVRRVKRMKDVNVNGRAAREPKQTWNEVVQNDL